MNDVFFLLGANLGEPLAQLRDAATALEKRVGTIKKTSSVYASAAWGVEDQPTFLNQVLLISTPLSAREVLQEIQQIENDLGRVRLQKWGARIIDIDILYYNNDVVDEEDLRIPHPYIAQRRFTLLPLVEIAPNYVHPAGQETNQELLQSCEDHLPVQLLSATE